MMRLYNLIFLLLLPAILLRTIYKSWKFGEKFSRNYEKLSLFNTNNRNSKKVIHIHAVSVGEVLASRKFVAEVKNKFPNHQILVTCTTQTVSETIKKLYGDSVAHQYLPFDISVFVNRFLNFWQPEITFLLDLASYKAYKRPIIMSAFIALRTSGLFRLSFRTPSLFNSFCIASFIIYLIKLFLCTGKEKVKDSSKKSNSRNHVKYHIP